MEMKNEHKRWPVALVVIAAVIVLSAALIYFFRSEKGDLLVHTVGDGSGGAIVAWQEKDGIYVQRIDSSGGLLWGKEGVKAANVNQPDPYRNYLFGFSLVEDNAGGAFLTWAESYASPRDVNDTERYQPVKAFSQHISSAGVLLWGGGVQTGKMGRYVSSDLPRLVPDGSGGCLYAWNDFQTVYRGLHDDFLRVQKLDADGKPVWGDNGVLIVESNPYRLWTEKEIAAGAKGTYGREFPTYNGRHTIVGDGAGGAVIFWQKEWQMPGETLYAQHIDGGGNIVWPENKKIADGFLHNAFYDGLDGFILQVAPVGGGRSRVMSLGLDGVTRWYKDVLTDPIDMLADIEPDGQGGIFIVFARQVGKNPGPFGNIMYHYVQKLDGYGNPLWPELPVFSQEMEQLNMIGLGIVPDSGGCYAVFREGTDNYLITGDIFCQLLNADGAALWHEGGLEVFNNKYLERMGYPLVVGDSAGGVIITAAVGRGAFSGDMVYAQRLDKNGSRLWGDGIRLDR